MIIFSFHLDICIIRKVDSAQVTKKALCHYSMFMNIILAFTDKNSNNFNYGNDFEFSDNLIILKRVKSLRQLRRTEKELVRLNYMEVIIKGFTLKGTQQYITTKTKIWIVVLPRIPQEGGGAGEQ